MTYSHNILRSWESLYSEVMGKFIFCGHGKVFLLACILLCTGQQLLGSRRIAAHALVNQKSPCISSIYSIQKLHQGSSPLCQSSLGMQDMCFPVLSLLQSLMQLTACLSSQRKLHVFKTGHEIMTYSHSLLRSWESLYSEVMGKFFSWLVFFYVLVNNFLVLKESLSMLW